MATVTLRGIPTQTYGHLPPVGSKAPDFKLVGSDLQDVSLATYKGKKKILNIVPSLDTSVCATSARKFNDEAKTLENTIVLIVSSDLPFASERFVSQEKLSALVPVSVMRDQNFAKDYGVLITSGPLAGICTRAVIVIDEADKVIHTELVSEIALEPDYDKALRSIRGQ
jgi:thiol peroxidase